MTKFTDDVCQALTDLENALDATQRCGLSRMISDAVGVRVAAVFDAGVWAVRQQEKTEHRLRTAEALEAALSAAVESGAIASMELDPDRDLSFLIGRLANYRCRAPR
jgi:hypothetical protein